MFELLIVDDDSQSSRVICQKTVYYPRSFPSGLEHALSEAFRVFLNNEISSIQAEVVLVPRARDLEHLVTISDTTLVWMNGRAFSFEGYKRKYGQNTRSFLIDAIIRAINLLAWKLASPQERFCPGAIPSVSRTCILCGNTQIRERSTQRPNMIDNALFGWPSDSCIDPSCFSHDIEHEIDSDYKIPKAAIEHEQAQSVIGEAVRVAVQKFSNLK